MTIETNCVERVWDSNVIVSFLAGDQLAGQFRLAEIIQTTITNNSRILVSRLATAEVAYFGNNRDHKEIEPLILAFFKSDAVVVAELSETISRIARSLVREYRFDGADAVHVATAVNFGIPNVETFDHRLLRRGRAFNDSGQFDTKITKPSFQGQPALPLDQN